MSVSRLDRESPRRTAASRARLKDENLAVIHKHNLRQDSSSSSVDVTACLPNR